MIKTSYAKCGWNWPSTVLLEKQQKIWKMCRQTDKQRPDKMWSAKFILAHVGSSQGEVNLQKFHIL